MPDTADEKRRAESRAKAQEEKLPDYGTVVTHDEVVFRGDSREPSEIFEVGFTQKRVRHMAGDLGELKQLVKALGAEAALTGAPLINVSGELVRYGISTSKEQSVVRRKYGHGRWIYAAVFPYGYDMGDVNKLDEVTGFYIPPENIIAGIGPR